MSTPLPAGGAGATLRAGEVLARACAAYGEWLRRNARLVRALQWLVVFVYAVLIVVPTFLPLPPDSARAFDNLTIFAQWSFWGLWWPLVIVSIRS